MRVLCVDVGTGTQDIYLYDSQVDVENGFKLVVPAPTMIVHRRLKQATERGEAVALTGVTMGGGPSHWAAESHLQAGFPVYATPDAARSFDDDLEMIRDMGIQVISEDELAGLPDDVVRLTLRDFDFQAIRKALIPFGVSLNDLAAVAVAVFDHGAAPPGYSDRQFRFDYLTERIRSDGRLSGFAYRAEDIPPIMTRMQAVANSSSDVGAPLVVMDTAPAAILGAMLDPDVRSRSRILITNVGNFHTLAFRMGGQEIEGVFEHHTGLLDRTKLEGLLESLANGRLKHEEVFADHGHGALIVSHEPLDIEAHDFVDGRVHVEAGGFGVIVTGPRRNLMRQSALRPYFATPFGDMMLAGCFGLLSAVADHVPDLEGQIKASLRGQGGSGTPPWEID